MIPNPVNKQERKKLDFRKIEKTLYVLAAFAAIFVLALSFTAKDDPTARYAQLEKMDVKPVSIETSLGETVIFNSEIAMTQEHVERGMMYRDGIADDAGMLFVFPSARPVAFWMRNTRIPLDIIFISEDGRITNIAANAKPYDETPLPSAGPVVAVLEIRGGLAAEKGIRPGNTVILPVIASPQ